MPEPGSLRVLVVDDMADVRTLMRRVLARCGYQVDEASSGSEARALGPERYDVVLIDANLGAESGTELIETMLAGDPAAAARCLLVTGGGAGPVPPGVGYLAKPFRPDELVAAVHARHEAAVAAGPPAHDLPVHEPPAHDPPAHGAAPHEPPASGVPSAAVPPAGGAAAGVPSAGPAAAEGAPLAGRAAGWPLIRLLRQARAAERAAVAGLLHDGPVQELTAAMLGLEVLAGQAPADLAPRFGEVREQLAAVSRPVRDLIDGWAPVLVAATGLAATVRQRTAWLPFREVTVEYAAPPPGGPAAPPPGGPSGPAAEADLAEIIELALFLVSGYVPAGRASVLVRTGQEGTGIQLTITGEPGGSPGPDGGGLRRALSGLAAALGGTARTETSASPWRATITLPTVW